MQKIMLWIQAVLLPTMGPFGIFVVALLDSSFLSLPEINDILVVSFSSVHPELAWLYATMATLGSLAGCSVLWVLGRHGGEPLLRRRFGNAAVDRTEAAFERFDTLALAIPAILPPPMPFKIFVLAAGVLRYPYRRFALTLILARGLRYAVWGALGAEFGDEALDYLHQIDRWFGDRMPYLLGLLLGSTAAALGIWLWRRYRARPGELGGDPAPR